MNVKQTNKKKTTLYFSPDHHVSTEGIKAWQTSWCTLLHVARGEAVARCEHEEESSSP